MLPTSGSVMLIPMPIWNRRCWCHTRSPWNPFYLLVGVLVPPASAGALAEGSPLQPGPEDCPWAMENTLPRVKMPSFEVGNPGKGYKSLPWQTLQNQGRLQTQALEDNLYIYIYKNNLCINYAPELESIWWKPHSCPSHSFLHYTTDASWENTLNMSHVHKVLLWAPFPGNLTCGLRP